MRWWRHEIPLPAVMVCTDQWWALEAVALHEFGHVLGLSHTKTEEVMFWSLTLCSGPPVLTDADRKHLETVLAAYPPAIG